MPTQPAIPARTIAIIFLACGLFSSPVQADEIKVVFPSQGTPSEIIRTFYLGNVEYMSVTDLVGIFSIRARNYTKVEKMVLYMMEGQIKISAFSSFVIINKKSYQMSMPSYYDGHQYFVPAMSFFKILGMTVMKGVKYDPVKRIFFAPASPLGYNIFGAVVELKNDGTLIRIRTTRKFDMSNVLRYITDNGWLVVQIPDGRVDSLALQDSKMAGLIKGVATRQLEKSAELRFRLSERVQLPEVYQVNKGDELYISLRNPPKTKNNLNDMRAEWHIDTIVIDPGHGGRDPGTIGRSNLYEKTITLDVALRLGKLLRQKTGVKVIYTRDDDRFVELWQRTKLANEAGGKLFISLHVNGQKNGRSAAGTETWLLAPANTPEAIEIAQRENSVIALEESNHKYENFSDESLILSTMAQSAWMKESEELGAIVQQRLAKATGRKSRGLKQSGFIVLIGAAMPKVLVELGFITNRLEENKLKQSEYRQKLAQALFEAIDEFKRNKDGILKSDT